MEYVWLSGQPFTDVTSASYDARVMPTPPPSASGSILESPVPTSLDTGTDQPANTQQEVVVESQLQFSFFEETILREPTQEEIDGMMDQTLGFFTQHLEQTYPDIDSFQAYFVDVFFDETGYAFPVLIEFDAIAQFHDGKFF